MEHAIICPQCNAPITPHRFAKSALCTYCGATVHFDETTRSAEIFHKAFKQWNDPRSHGFSTWISIGNDHWALQQKIAEGDISDVYFGQRARWPSELVIIKILRNPNDKALFENEWQALQTLHHSNAPGAEVFSTFLPQLVQHGSEKNAKQSDQQVSIFRRESGFRHTLAAVIQAYPQGIPPRTSIWLWRRILELLSFIHTSGMVHGAVLPQHILIQDQEHGARLVDFTCTGKAGDKLSSLSSEYKSCYPKWMQSSGKLSTQADLVMSARCIIAALGGNPAKASLPDAVPTLLAEKIQQVALADQKKSSIPNAWAIREELGSIARQVFGPSKFNPIDMSF
ncbi:MAG: serine/threonine protein kinase [Anaerolineaceae bacterium]|nr:serine/threonine protein kinase [Anaerolineaceae bacterium]